MATNGGSYAIEVKSFANTNSKSKKCGFLAQLVIRSLTAMFALASLLVLIKSGQTTTMFGFEVQAKYSYSSAFRFLLGVDIAICAFSLISLFSICAFYGPNASSKGHFFVFLHDLIAMVLMISGCAAATAIGYVGRYGQDETGWSKICDNVKKFCDYIMVSIALSYMAFICLLVLTVLAFKRATQASC